MHAQGDRIEHRAWLDYAERDLSAARALWSIGDGHREAVVYWAQQSAEKALKAVLVLEEAAIPRTHDLAVLRSLSRAYTGGGAAHEDLSLLTRQAAGSRYPDLYVPLDDDDVLRALACAESVITEVTRIITEKENR